MQLFLRFGGAELCYSRKTISRSALARELGQEVAIKLGQADQQHGLPRRVPIGNRWIAATLKARGKTVAEIARTVRASDTAVRGWLKDADKREGEDKPV